MFCIGIVNHSTKVDDSAINIWKNALNRQVGRDFAPIWGVYCTITYPAAPAPFAKVPWPLYIENDADISGALGYHDVDKNGVPFIKVFVNDSASAGVALSAVMSHEILEVLGDPNVVSLNMVDNGDGTGRIYYTEVCDPTEADLYFIDGVAVSNFVTPWWFTDKPPAGVKLDFLGTLNAPLTISAHGYFLFRDIQRMSPWNESFGKKARPWNGTKEEFGMKVKSRKRT